MLTTKVPRVVEVVVGDQKEQCLQLSLSLSPSALPPMSYADKSDFDRERDRLIAEIAEVCSIAYLSCPPTTHADLDHGAFVASPSLCRTSPSASRA